MRQFIRHPSSIPLHYDLCDQTTSCDTTLRNVGVGGLCFETGQALEPGQQLHLVIDVCDPPFETQAEVVWCHSLVNGFETGVCFESTHKAYAVRMVEQVCHIQAYMEEVRQKEQRCLTRDQAAKEWIAKYASHFPCWEVPQNQTQ